MVGKDPLSSLLRITNCFALNPVKYDSSSEKYKIPEKRWLLVLVNSVFYLAMNAFYLWHVFLTLDERHKMYGHIFGLLLVLDSQLCFCWVYTILGNVLLKSKVFLKMINTHLNIRQQMITKFGGPHYAKNKRQLNISITFNLLYNIVFSLSYQMLPPNDETTWIVNTVSVIFVILAVFGFTCLIQFNAFLIILSTDLSFITDCTRDAIARNDDIYIQTKIYFELLAVMHHLMKAYTLPIMVCVMLIFYEGTVQLFQIFLLLSHLNAKKQSLMFIVNDVITYAVWLWPLMMILGITMNNAASTSRKVSYVCLISSYFKQPTPLLYDPVFQYHRKAHSEKQKGSPTVFLVAKNL